MEYNYKRIAEVWLDEYKEYFYYYRPELLVRRQLACYYYGLEFFLKAQLFGNKSSEFGLRYQLKTSVGYIILEVEMMYILSSPE